MYKRHLCTWMITNICVCLFGALAQAQADDVDSDDLTKQRALLIREPLTSQDLARSLATTLEPLVKFISDREYVRQARSRGVPWYSEEAFVDVLPRQNVALAVVLGNESSGRGKHVRVVLRDGTTGKVISEQRYSTGGGSRLSTSAKSDIYKAVQNAIRAKQPAQRQRQQASDKNLSTAKAAADPEIMPAEPKAPDTEAAHTTHDEASTMSASLNIGVGAAMRTLSLPGINGFQRLSTDLFPAIDVAFDADYRPNATGLLSIALGARYLTSVGLRVVDLRGDGTTRTTSARVQYWDAHGGLNLRTSRKQHSVVIHTWLGWAVSSFAAEMAITFPDYSFSGPFIRLGGTFPIGKGVVSLHVSAQASLVFTSDDLEVLGANATGSSFAGEAFVRIRIHEHFALDAAYREAHTLVSTVQGGTATDVARWITARLVLTP